jgi:hypothetical protein
MKPINYFFLVLFAAISVSVNAQKPNTKVEPLMLECNVTGRITTYGFQLNNFDRDIKNSLSVLISNGIISVRDTESVFPMDVPVTITDNEYAGQFQFNTENNSRVIISVVINRYSGTIRASRDASGNDGRGLSIKTSGDCNKVSDKKKF